MVDTALSPHEQHLEDGIYASGCALCEAEAAEEGTPVVPEGTARPAGNEEEAPPVESGLMVVEETESALLEGEPDGWHDDPKAAAEPERPEEPTIDEDQVAVATRAQLLAYSVKHAQNGANIDAQIEVDTYVASEFEEEIGENLFDIWFDKRSYGLARIVAVGTRTDADNRPRSKVSLKWSQDQRKKTKDLVDLVGVLGLTIKLVRHQFELDLTEKA